MINPAALEHQFIHRIADLRELAKVDAERAHKIVVALTAELAKLGRTRSLSEQAVEG